MESIFRGLLPLETEGALRRQRARHVARELAHHHPHLDRRCAPRGYELRNIIIWDRTNIVNCIGIFGWSSNYITMGVTFEYPLDF
jgi:hypothetical protein